MAGKPKPRGARRRFLRRSQRLRDHMGRYQPDEKFTVTMRTFAPGKVRPSVTVKREWCPLVEAPAGFHIVSFAVYPLSRQISVWLEQDETFS